MDLIHFYEPWSLILLSYLIYNFHFCFYLVFYIINVILVHDDERMTALRNALVCTVLASAGQQRSRMLATLFKDERCQQLPAVAILEKMYLERIIRR